jgi:hypothetical protein
MTLQEALLSGRPYKQVGDTTWIHANDLDKFSKDEVLGDYVVQTDESRAECERLKEQIGALRTRYWELGGL